MFKTGAVEFGKDNGRGESGEMQSVSAGYLHVMQEWLSYGVNVLYFYDLAKIRCKQYQALPESDRSHLDLQLFELAQNSRWRRCPGCQSMVEKVVNTCFYMSCVCGTRFCYDCGKKVCCSFDVS